MNIRCPHCQALCRVKGPCAEDLRGVDRTCPRCDGSIEVRSLSTLGETGDATDPGTRCAIISAGKRLRLFDIAPRAKTKSESLT